MEMHQIFQCLSLGYKIKPVDDFIFSFEITANHANRSNLDGSEQEKKNKKLLHIFWIFPSQDWYVFSDMFNLYFWY